MMARGSKTRLRVAVLGALILVINAVAFAAFTWPRLNSVRRAESRAQEVAVQKVAFEALWSQLEARRALAAQNRKDVEALNTVYLKARAVDLFAAQRDVESMAVEAGLRPKRSTYAIEKIKGTNLVRCSITMPLDGSYANLTGFLSRVESAKRFIVVEQMSISQDEQVARMSLKLSAVFKDGDSRATQ